MKRRILLSLVSFFVMTAMWASLVDAYQIYVTAANGKTYNTAELTLNMKNRNAIAAWTCELVLPVGVTYESVAIVDGRYPEGYNAEIVAVPGNDNIVKITCSGAEGLTLTGTDGAVATVTVAIAGDAPLGDCVVTVKNAKLVEADGISVHNYETKEFTWTIEEGENPNPGVTGDLNGDGNVDIADGVAILSLIASNSYDAAADLNGDQKIDIADFVAILVIMAGGAE